MRKRKWSELSKAARIAVISGASIEGILKIIALIDLKRRPADQIRGSKRRWATAVAFANSGGAVPLAYLVLGRKAKPSS